MSNHGGELGDEPDTFEGRLEVITRLIDTIDDELDDLRRRKRQSLIIRLLAHLARDTNTRIVLQLERLDLV